MKYEDAKRILWIIVKYVVTALAGYFGGNAVM